MRFQLTISFNILLRIEMKTYPDFIKQMNWLIDYIVINCLLVTLCWGLGIPRKLKPNTPSPYCFVDYDI